MACTWSAPGTRVAGAGFAGVAATPEWTGNLTASYLVGNFGASMLMRYIGGAVLDKRWVDDPAEPGYFTETGTISNATVDNNSVKAYARFDLNLSYDLRIANMKQFRLFGAVTGELRSARSDNAASRPFLQSSIACSRVTTTFSKG